MHKIQAILALEPPPLLSLAPHLPLELVEIVTKMIQKDPAERYVSIRSCRYDIEQLQKLRRETKPFVVGETDQFARLRFPDHLIGMDEQISVIKASYRQAAFGEHVRITILDRISRQLSTFTKVRAVHSRSIWAGKDFSGHADHNVLRRSRLLWKVRSSRKQHILGSHQNYPQFPSHTLGQPARRRARSLASTAARSYTRTPGSLLPSIP